MDWSVGASEIPDFDPNRGTAAAAPSSLPMAYAQWRSHFSEPHVRQQLQQQRNPPRFTADGMVIQRQGQSALEMKPLGIQNRAGDNVELSDEEEERNGDDDGDDTTDPGEPDVDEAEQLLRQQTLVMDHAATTTEVVPLITYGIAFGISVYLTATYLPHITDQSLLLVLGTVIILIFLQGAHWMILHFSLPRNNNSRTDGEDSLAAATETVRKRMYQAVGRLAHSLLFILLLIQYTVLLILVSVAGTLLFNVAGRSFPEAKFQPFTVLLGILYVLFFILVVVFASQPAIGMLTRSNAFLATPVANPSRRAAASSPNRSQKRKKESRVGGGRY